jgi:hypothetical protein
MNNFEKAVEFTLQFEGEGGEASPGDPGGLTKWGISQRSHPNLDIANLTREQAIEIYRTEYWDRLRCDRLPARFDVAMFDTAVNVGCGRAESWVSAGSFLWQDLLLRRVAHYVALAQGTTYFRGILFGLLRRVCALATLCRSMQ